MFQPEGLALVGCSWTAYSRHSQLHSMSEGVFSIRSK